MQTLDSLEIFSGQTINVRVIEEISESSEITGVISIPNSDGSTAMLGTSVGMTAKGDAVTLSVLQTPGSGDLPETDLKGATAQAIFVFAASSPITNLDLTVTALSDTQIISFAL